MSTDLQSITFVPNYAGFKLRLIAYFIDWVILIALQATLFLSLVFIAWLSETARHEHYAFLLQVIYTILLIVLVTLLFLSNLLYFTIFESSKLMATPGKLVLGIVVTDSAGERNSFWRAFSRNIAKFLSCFLLYAGFVMAAFTKKKQALHDIIADCLVVKRQ